MLLRMQPQFISIDLCVIKVIPMAVLGRNMSSSLTSQFRIGTLHQASLWKSHSHQDFSKISQQKPRVFKAFSWFQGPEK